MPDVLLVQLAQLGAAGLLIWYLWRDNATLRQELRDERQRHRDELERLRRQHGEELEKHREQIAERDRARFKEATDHGTYLWQIANALQRFAMGNRRDDQGWRLRSGGEQQPRRWNWCWLWWSSCALLAAALRFSFLFHPLLTLSQHLR